nr:Wzy polymerase domain-containing protein [Pantoea sp. 201603H]
MTHPHNEYLYRWAEGGVIALTGMLLFTLCGVWLFMKAVRRDRLVGFTGHSFGPGMGFCLLPLLMHTQTEYPFYLSALHWGVFILLLAVWDKQLTRQQQLISLSFPLSDTGRGALAVVMYATLIFTATGGYSGWLLWRFEQQHFEGEMPRWNINPWLLSERATFDGQVASLLAFNHDRDPFRLEDYLIWSQDYSAVHIDREVYARRVQILRARGIEPLATQWEAQAYGLFPDDPRFQPRTISDGKGR